MNQKRGSGSTPVGNGRTAKGGEGGKNTQGRVFEDVMRTISKQIEGIFLDKLHSKQEKVILLTHSFLFTARQRPSVRTEGKPCPGRYLLEGCREVGVGNGIQNRLLSPTYV